MSDIVWLNSTDVDTIGMEVRKMLADAWDEGHNHCFHVEDPRNDERNPYRT